MVGEMVLVRGSTFAMGGGDHSLHDSRPIHTVHVDDFMIASHPVTRREWNELFPSDSKYEGYDDCPAVSISWYEAVEYCNRLSARHGLSLCYTIYQDSVTPRPGANGYRLPTEAEWEFAARGGDQGNGFVFAGSNTLRDIGWFKGNSGGHPQPVGGKSPNELGLFDMSGNVWEWCWDCYGPYPADHTENPLGARDDCLRVYRGGSWVDFEHGCEVAARGRRAPSRGYDDIGLRVARSV